MCYFYWFCSLIFIFSNLFYTIFGCRKGQRHRHSRINISDLVIVFLEQDSFLLPFKDIHVHNFNIKLSKRGIDFGYRNNLYFYLYGTSVKQCKNSRKRSYKNLKKSRKSTLINLCPDKLLLKCITYVNTKDSFCDCGV